jgi:hypothetical protein
MKPLAFMLCCGMRRPHLAPTSPASRSAISNGRHLLPNIDGRSGRARRFRDLCADLARDFGGEAALSSSDKALVKQAAGLCDHHVLVDGEQGVLLCIAPDQRQASITLDYATAAFEASSIMSELIANRTADALELTNGVTIEVRSASFRCLRGPTYIGVIADVGCVLVFR